ncbi:MAG: zinc-ribbon domain-containing protein, partial [Oscillibacter sp.]|nr:zinc-ribbon domain-containing protein [Oscillibacter sp.]
MHPGESGKTVQGYPAPDGGVMMMKACPHCGASLPTEASFCPSCAKSIQPRTEVIPP